MARAMHRRCCWPPERLKALALQLVLDLVPQGGPGEALLDQVVHVALEPVDLRGDGDVVVDGLRERVGLLEHHADAPPDLDGLHPGAVERLPIEVQAALDPGSRDEIVEPVKAAQERGLAAAGRADQGGDLPLGDGHADVAQGLVPTRRRSPGSRRRRPSRRGSAATCGPAARRLGRGATVVDARRGGRRRSVGVRSWCWARLQTLIISLWQESARHWRLPALDGHPGRLSAGESGDHPGDDDQDYQDDQAQHAGRGGGGVGPVTG